MIAAMEHVRVHAIVLSGGAGRRLGGQAKSELVLGGHRLLELVLAGVEPLVSGTLVVVAGDDVRVPAGVQRTIEEPAGGGPLAGIGAGFSRLAPGQADLVVVAAVDTPAAGELATLLERALGEDGGKDGSVILGGRPQPFRQYLQALYRAPALARALDAVRADKGTLHHRAVWRALGALDLIDVPVPAELCRDLDTPEDLRWWRERLSGARPAGRRSDQAEG
ncbi:Molybdopterin-guanine dinucleotide biosynthesis protein A [Propionibacterium cyclohexanicum]|uniref:Molybdopterin-guanine dinucleotide biosynthesis protein A n=2 Tax=Propionibacterium cyclohexanicum TaxID=64702 RepID=A0A1H9RJ64_9ACTN|nr:Molybdopterin-guanine dinucleotide biosynthesis protein A [Propionibacterium cyclohexanicum]